MRDDDEEEARRDDVGSVLTSIVGRGKFAYCGRAIAYGEDKAPADERARHARPPCR